MAEDGLTVEKLVEHLTLANVYCLKFSADLERTASAESFRVSITPSYRVAADRYDFLFDTRCEVMDEGQNRLATIEDAHVATFDVGPEVDAESVDTDLVEWIGSHVASFAVFPYIRESVQTHALRLGFGGLTMDIMRRGEPLPEGLTFDG